MSLLQIPNFYKETLTQEVPTGTTNIYVTNAPSVDEGYLTISPASTTLREIVYFTSKGNDENGDYVVISDAGDRGIGGTTEQTHVIGEPIRMNVGAETIQEINDKCAIISSGSGAPASTPEKIGDIYVDTSGSKFYFAKGTSSSADWIIVN